MSDQMRTNRKGYLIDEFEVDLMNFQTGGFYGYYLFSKGQFTHHTTKFKLDQSKTYVMNFEWSNFFEMKKAPTDEEASRYLMTRSELEGEAQKQSFKVLKVYFHETIWQEDGSKQEPVTPVAYYLQRKNGEKGLLVRNDRQY